MMISEEYTKCLRTGPFPARVDPWAEVANYFQQIHPGLIGALLGQIQPTLLRMGYIVSLQESAQIDDLGEANIDDVDLHAIYIRQMGTGRLVTIVEIISPETKTKPNAIADYRSRRERLLFEHRVNIVEIDLTRSVKRLLTDSLTASVSYHYAIYLPHDSPRVIGIDYGESLKRMALPLRGEVIPIELQPAYDEPYQTTSIAAQILHNDHYREDLLPFPTLLNDQQRHEAWERVTIWKQELERLRDG